MEIQQSYGYNKSAIAACCLGKNKSAYGFIWRYEETLNKEILLVSAQAKSVLQLDKNSNLIKEYNSVAEAQKTTGINNISACCTGNRKSAGGYIWRYKELKQT